LTSEPANNIFYQAWSPDKSRFAFVASRGSGEVPPYTFLYVIRSDGTGFRKLIENVGGNNPSWSPEGSRIAVLAGDLRSIYVIEADGTGAIQIPSGEALNNPEWSPDGAWLAFDTVDGDEGEDIALVRSTCTGIRRLTRSAGNDCLPAWRPR
jgi:dipeptidyl aminopeptidase/acylaminoacyl peptidase